MVAVGDCTFGVALTGSFNGPSIPLNMTNVFANRQNAWIISTDQCRTTLDSSYAFMEICSGMQAYTTSQVQTTGAFPSTVGFDWLSTSHNDVDTGCRGGVVLLTKGVAVGLNQVAGGVYSSSRQTSWSFFSITNSMLNTSGLFSAYGTVSYVGFVVPLRLLIKII